MTVPNTVPIIDIPNLSWATATFSALFVVDLSTTIGEYFRALESSPYWSSDPSRLRRGRRAVTRASLEVIFIALTVVVASGYAVIRATQGMDWRMTAVLEGVSRLEAAFNVSFVSVKAPRWIGVYRSSQREATIQHVGRGLGVLRFHVRYSICQYFFLVFCVLLPFCGKPVSFVLGVLTGLFLDAFLYVARRSPVRVKARIALSLSLTLAGAAAVLFADGCHYIQIVWGRGWQNEWGLGLITFSAWLISVLIVHWRMWRKTQAKLMMERRFTRAEIKERMAVSLIFSRVFGSRALGISQDLTASTLQPLEEMNEKEPYEAIISSTPEDEDSPSTWSLIKTRWSTPSDLIIFTKAEKYIIPVFCLASLFVVVVNIGATMQMKVVKHNFHSVHAALYGEMDEGPVCAFDKVGGTISTFDTRSSAHRAGYKVAHCGACGACSGWHNLRLQYTTRTYLAKASARCARRSLVGGRDAVLDCLRDDPVGFRGKCAECWADDILCARNHCAFIFLQSNMINTMANFEVGEDIITSATCEEAMCELEFVPCSGANRRRMHITSTIKRPGMQLCSIVDADWAEVFGEDASTSTSGVAGGKEEL